MGDKYYNNGKNHFKIKFVCESTDVYHNFNTLKEEHGFYEKLLLKKTGKHFDFSTQSSAQVYLMPRK